MEPHEISIRVAFFLMFAKEIPEYVELAVASARIKRNLEADEVYDLLLACQREEVVTCYRTRGVVVASLLASYYLTPPCQNALAKLY